MNSSIDVFLAFEGGGAKGVVHVGALRALEERIAAGELALKGVAGTSAGAIVAALVAAGHRSDELLNPEGASPLLAQLGLPSATALFGRWGWLRIRRWPTFLISALTLIAAGLLATAVLASYHRWEAGFAVVASLLGLCMLRRFVRGLTSLDFFAERFNAALAGKLGAPAGAKVTFSDLPLPLRIVATNVERRELELFSDEQTPRVSVAEAVAASVSIPFLFRPRRLGPHSYWDGGIVSNLPVWAFDEERTLNPDAVTVALEIQAGRAQGAVDTAWGLLKSLALAALFGGGALNKRAANRLEVFALDTDIGLLDFGMSKATAARSVRDAQSAVRALVNFRLFELRNRYEEACREVHDFFEELARKRTEQTGLPVPAGKIRVNVAGPDPGATKSLRIRYGHRIAGEPDDDLLLPLEGSMTGRAFVSGDVELYVAPFPDDVSFPGAQNRHRRRLAWEAMKWCLAMPIYRSGWRVGGVDVPLLALNVDSDIEIAYFGLKELTEEQLRELAETIAALVAPAVELEIGGPG